MSSKKGTESLLEFAATFSYAGYDQLNYHVKVLYSQRFQHNRESFSLSFLKHLNFLRFLICNYLFIYFINNSKQFVVINKYQARMHNIYFTWLSCCHIQKQKSNAHRFSFCKKINSNRQNCGEENGTLLVNEFFIGTVNRQKVTSIDNHKHVPSTD